MHSRTLHKIPEPSIPEFFMIIVWNFPMLFCAVKIVTGNFPMHYCCKETRNFFGTDFLFVFVIFVFFRVFVSKNITNFLIIELESFILPEHKKFSRADSFRLSILGWKVHRQLHNNSWFNIGLPFHPSFCSYLSKSSLNVVQFLCGFKVNAFNYNLAAASLLRGVKESVFSTQSVYSKKGVIKLFRFLFCAIRILSFNIYLK